jgi:hypothetical protein
VASRFGAAQNMTPDSPARLGTLRWRAPVPGLSRGARARCAMQQNGVSGRSHTRRFVPPLAMNGACALRAP